MQREPTITSVSDPKVEEIVNQNLVQIRLISNRGRRATFNSLKEPFIRQLLDVIDSHNQDLKTFTNYIAERLGPILSKTLVETQ